MYKAIDAALSSNLYTVYIPLYVKHKGEKNLYKNVITCLKIRPLTLKMQTVTRQSVINSTGNLGVWSVYAQL